MLLPPGDSKGCNLRGAARACNIRDAAGTTRRREVTAGVCQGSHRLRLVAGPENPPPPILGLGVEAKQGMTNAMNAIANQVIRNSGRTTWNAGWPYFNGTNRDYPAFKRKFPSFQAITSVHHQGS